MYRDLASVMAMFALPSECSAAAESILRETIEYSNQRNPKAAEIVCSRRLMCELAGLGCVLSQAEAKNLLGALMRFYFASQYRCPTDLLAKASTCNILTTMRRLRVNKEQYSRSMKPMGLKIFPVHELVLAFHGENDATKIQEYRRRWIKKGGLLFSGRMIAPATSPIWIEMSNFHLPYPPYDFECGFDRTEVDRQEGIKFGLIKPSPCRPELKAAAKLIKYKLKIS